MLLNPNHLSTNILVTLATLAMVFILPWLDQTICRKLGVSLNDGISTHPQADRIRHIRKYLLIGLFVIYLLLVGYVAFFSRSASEDYHVHTALFESLSQSIRIDFGILGFIGSIFSEGLNAALSHVRIQRFESIAQVYMNICMFIPMGYLLPYIFDWFRRKVRLRTVSVCFLSSLAIENLQLITKLGYYDVDDLFANTIGGFIGVSCYLSFAYMLAHPDWKNEMKNRQLWRREARTTALYPFFRKVHYPRITLYGTECSDILDYYVTKLGMYLRRTIVASDGQETAYLLEFGANQLEIRVGKQYRDLPVQTITLACNNSEYLKKRLIQYGIAVSDQQADPYTGLLTYSFEGPDQVRIVIIEE